MSWHHVGTAARQSSPQLEIDREVLGEGSRQLNSENIFDDDGEEDGIDLEDYEEYLEHLKSKTAIRPCSARITQPMPADSSRFFMANAANPVPTRPVRPVSARPRMRYTPRSSLDDHTLKSSQSHSNGVGVRRKRQGEKMVHARIRAVYNDVGRPSLPIKQMAAPYSGTSTLNSKPKGLQEAEVHDEYYRLLDAESELKAACLQEQRKRIKAVAHVRRLEEIIAMKDRKIESLLHDKAVGADRSPSTNKSVSKRETAERDRQFHALTQKLRQKIAQQSQQLNSYEEAMQSLRIGIKSTNLMELEEERSQLYQELRHHQELLDRQRLEWESLQHKLVAFTEAEASSKLQIAKLQQENKIIGHEKLKLEQEIGFLKSRVELLQSSLTLEQRKRTYDREFSESVGKHTSSSPTQKVMLAQALEEMKKLVRRETAASIKREKLKSPKSRALPQRSGIYAPGAQSKAPVTSSAPKTQSRSTVASPSRLRAANAASIQLEGSAIRQNTSFAHLASENWDYNSAAVAPPMNIFSPVANVTLTVQDQDRLESEQFDGHAAGYDEPKEVLSVIPVFAEGRIPRSQEDQLVEIGPDGTDVNFTGANVTKDSEQAEVDEPSKTKSPITTVEADPGNGQQSGDDPCAPAADGHEAGRITDEKMSEIQQQQLATIASVLRLELDDDPDSELSADMLDDAHHLRSDPQMKGIDSVDDVADALINFEVPKEDIEDMEQKAPSSLPLVSYTVEAGAQEETQDEGGQLSLVLDDLYGSDFLDADVQASVEDSEDDEEST